MSKNQDYNQNNAATIALADRPVLAIYVTPNKRSAPDPIRRCIFLPI